jgi:hypothetical protein
MKQINCDVCQKRMMPESNEFSQLILHVKVNDTVNVVVKAYSQNHNHDVCSKCLRFALRKLTDEPSFQRLTKTA